jgi:hypothetical protein
MVTNRLVYAAMDTCGERWTMSLKYALRYSHSCSGSRSHVRGIQAPPKTCIDGGADCSTFAVDRGFNTLKLLGGSWT